MISVLMVFDPALHFLISQELLKTNYSHEKNAKPTIRILWLLPQILAMKTKTSASSWISCFTVILQEWEEG